MNKFAIGCGGLLVIVLFIVFVIGLFFWGTYNRLVTLDQNVNKKWGDVQTVYQRRADLIPNLVNTVQGAANFEKSTIVEVTNARASVGRVQRANGEYELRSACRGALARTECDSGTQVRGIAV